MKINSAIPLPAQWSLMCLVFISCAPISYLTDRQPTDLIFQKRTYGGAAALVGTELSAPAFSLYADGTVIYYHYLEGKRILALSRLSESEFNDVYSRIQKNLSVHLDEIPKQTGAPVTEFVYASKTIAIEGLGFIHGIPLLDTLQKFSESIDQMTFGKNKKYFSKKIVLYVKKLLAGEPQIWPEWKIKEIDPDSIYKKDLSFYEPNDEENSKTLEGTLAKNIQNEIEQASIYQKFSFKGKIYAIGYRPVISRD
jgi:hypothetical protein